MNTNFSTPSSNTTDAVCLHSNRGFHWQWKWREKLSEWENKRSAEAAPSIADMQA